MSDEVKDIIDSTTAYAANPVVKVETKVVLGDNAEVTTSTPTTAPRYYQPQARSSQEVQPQEQSDVSKVADLIKGELHDKANKGANAFLKMFQDDKDRDIPPVDVVELLKAIRVPLLLAILYYLSPIDILPDQIPGAGLIDDLGAAMIVFQFAFKKKYQELTGLKLTMADMIKGRAMINAVIANVVGSLVHLLDFTAVGLVVSIPVTGGVMFITFKSFISAVTKGQKISLKDILSALFSFKFKKRKNKDREDIFSKDFL